MSWFVNLRNGAVAGTIAKDAYVLKGDAFAHDPPRLAAAQWLEWSAAIQDRHLLLNIHGFNVSYRNGVRSTALLADHLALGDGYVVAGVLWPGDWWLPVVNYPAEAKDAVICGKSLAAFVNTRCKGARSVSIASHSLGGRVVLETLAGLAEPAAMACVTAAAVDDNVFAKQYKKVVEKAGRIYVLASKHDEVLRLAYPIGDFASDIAYDNDSPLRRALGRLGSSPRRDLDYQIPGALDYGHKHYFPQAEPNPPPANAMWKDVSRFIRRCVLNETQTWPPPGAP